VRRVDRRDVLVCASLFVGVLLVLLNRPHNLLMADEAYYLGIAKRLFDGEVLYRDVFDFLPPLFHWYCVAVYYAFGVSIEAARSAMAASHALYCVLLYLTCRGTGVRRSFAAVAVAAYLVLAQSPWSYVSPHWFATFWMTLLFYLLFVRAWAADDRRAFVLGMVVAVLGCTQHHKGVVVAAGVTTVLILSRAFLRETAAAERGRRIGRAIVRLAAGAALVSIPCLLVAILRAGAEPVVEALFIMPLRDYAAYRSERPSWAEVSIMTHALAKYTVPAVLRWSPIVLPLSVALSAWSRWARGAEGALPSTVLQAVFALFWAGAVIYFPDFIHVAFIFPVFLIIGAQVLEALLPRRAAWGRSAGWVVAVLLAAGLGAQLYANEARFASQFPLARQTAFGEVAYAVPHEIALLERVDEVLDRSGDRRLYCYPVCSLYLTADARNPTRHQFLLPSHNPSQHFREVIESLAADPPPAVVAVRFPPVLEDHKRLMDFVLRHYEASQPELPGFAVYVRKSAAPGRRVTDGES
jgi:hypothetical protein